MHRRRPRHANHDHLPLAACHNHPVMNDATAGPPTTPRVTIPGYELAEEIGRGGHAIVYRAQQLAVSRDVAVKVVARLDVSGTVQARFESEAQAAGTLSWHPNVVAVHDAGTTSDGLPYLAMEMLEGGTLAERLEREGRLSAEEACRIGVQLSGALAAAHAAALLHRDVKPENVLIGRFDEAKLADFGIAKVAGSTATATGVVTASYAHAAPEVLNGSPATVASDVYSLGSTMYRLLAGRAAFVESTDEAIVPFVMRVANAPVPDLRGMRVPDLLAEAVEWTMAKDPKDRPTSAAGFGAALQAVQRTMGWEVTELRLPEGVETPVAPAPKPPPAKEGEPPEPMAPSISRFVREQVQTALSEVADANTIRDEVRESARETLRDVPKSGQRRAHRDDDDSWQALVGGGLLTAYAVVHDWSGPTLWIGPAILAFAMLSVIQGLARRRGRDRALRAPFRWTSGTWWWLIGTAAVVNLGVRNEWRGAVVWVGIAVLAVPAARWIRKRVRGSSVRQILLVAVLLGGVVAVWIAATPDDPRTISVPCTSDNVSARTTGSAQIPPAPVLSGTRLYGRGIDAKQVFDADTGEAVGTIDSLGTVAGVADDVVVVDLGSRLRGFAVDDHREVWTADYGPGDAASSTHVLVDDLRRIAAVGLLDGRLLGVDTSTGAVRWERSDFSLFHDLATDGNRLYVDASSGERGEKSGIWALDLDSGRTRWYEEGLGGAIGVGSHAYVPGHGGSSSVLALRRDFGDVHWELATCGDVTGPASVGRERAFAYTDRGEMFSFADGTGEVTWRRHVEFPHVPAAFTAAAASPEGQVVVLSAPGYAVVRAFDGDTGKELWSYDGTEPLSRPVVTEDWTYVADQETVFAFDTLTGGERWRVADPLASPDVEPVEVVTPS